MKTKKFNKKLVLRKQMIAHLDDPHMGQVRGGDNTLYKTCWDTCYTNCFNSCNGTCSCGDTIKVICCAS